MPSEEVKIFAASVILSYLAYTAYRHASAKHPSPPFSIETEGARKGRTGVFRNPVNAKGLTASLPGKPELTTLWAIMEDVVRRFPNNPCHGVRVLDPTTKQAGEFKWTTYGETFEKIKAFSSGLVNLRLLQPDVENTMNLLGLYANNCPQWVIAEYAAFGQSATTVPLYVTLSLDELCYILNQTGTATVFCSEATAPKLIEAKAQCPKLKNLILSPTQTASQADVEGIVAKAKAAGLLVVNFEDVLRSGQTSPQPLRPPKADSIFSFCYTSGSTGSPKGALLSHANLVSNVAAFVEMYNSAPETRLTDGAEYYLSYLPLAHQMERTMQAAFYSVACRIGFYQGDPKLLVSDIGALRPTIFVSVPRVLNRVHDAIVSGAEKAGGLKAKLFHLALNSKKASIRAGHLTSPFWDALVFHKIAKKIGLDRCRHIGTGSAPIAGPMLDNLRAFFSCQVGEGYGQTECTCLATNTPAYHYSHSHVGCPAVASEICLMDVTEMNYLATDSKHGTIPVRGRGEVCLRGPGIMQGYYRMPEKTKEAIDSEGWLHTGDVGCWLEDGTLKIIDRVKNIFKLSQGEFVAPEKIENIICRAPLVAQAFVHGTTMNSCLIGVIVPDVEVLAHYCAQNGIPLQGDSDAARLASASKNETIKSAIHKQIDEICRKEGLHGYEVPKAIYLSPFPFDPSNSVLTSTMKMQRTNARKVYLEQLKEMYKALNEPVGA